MSAIHDEIIQTLEVLKKGGIILYPTDTIWGIGCDATNPEAVKKIMTLKKRSDSKSLIVLLHQASNLLSYLRSVPEQAWTLIEYAEKPLTIIYEEAKNLAENVIAKDGSVGIRIVRDEFCYKLIERFRKPIVSTSANLSGEDAPESFEDIHNDIKSGVDYIVNLKRNERKKTSPSTIIRLRSNGQIEFIRK